MLCLTHICFWRWDEIHIENSNEIPTRQDSDKMKVYHSLHGLKRAASETNGSITNCEVAVLAQFLFYSPCFVANVIFYKI
jgi:hypothetical protein